MGINDNGKDNDDGEFTVHYTMIFTVFVYMQIFNEINSRMLQDEANVFKYITQNMYFCVIWIVTFGVQVVMTQYGGIVMQTTKLDAKEWGIVFAIGAGQLLWGILMRFLRPSLFAICRAPKGESEEEAKRKMWQAAKGSVINGTMTIEQVMRKEQNRF